MKTLMKWIILPLIVTVIGGVIIYYIENELDNRTDKLTIESSNGVIAVTNNTDDVLQVRVGYAVVDETGTSYCYPNQASERDTKRLLPNETIEFPLGNCSNFEYNGYHVWAWDSAGKLVFEKGD